MQEDKTSMQDSRWYSFLRWHNLWFLYMYEKNWLILSSCVVGGARWKALSIFPLLLMGSEKWCFPEEWIPTVPTRHQGSTTLWHTKKIIKLFYRCSTWYRPRGKKYSRPGGGVGSASNPSLIPCQENTWLSFCWREFLHGYVERSASHTWANVITGEATVSGVLKSVKMELKWI